MSRARTTFRVIKTILFPFTLGGISLIKMFFSETYMLMEARLY